MRKGVAAVFLLAGLAGCAQVRPWGSEASSLAAAVALVARGQEEKGREALREIASRPPVPGVTDEALFRLGILLLRREGENGGGAEAQQVLERLQKDFPRSPWTLQASPLLGYLANARRNQKALRESNASLTRENRDLRQTIDRLKALELQLEHRQRR